MHSSKTHTAFTTRTNTRHDTIYKIGKTTITDTRTVFTTLSTALQTITTSTVTEITTTATATDYITVSTATELSTLSTEADFSTVETDFLTVYTPTVTDTSTTTTTKYVPDKLKARAYQPPDCWTKGYAASRLSSACSCVITSPSPTKTVYTKTKTVSKTITKTDIVEVNSIIYDTIVLTRSVHAVATLPVTSTSTTDVDATTILGTVATADVDVTATSIEDVTTTTVIDTTLTSVVDIATTTEATATATSTVSCPNPLVNGGFDTGSLSPWTSRGTATAAFVSPGYDSSPYALQLTFSANDDVYVLDQEVNVCPGLTYTYSLWVKITSGQVFDVNVDFFGTFYSVTGGQNFLIGTGDYQEVTGSFSPVNSQIGVEVDIELETESECSGCVVLVDDFVIIPSL